MAAARRGAPPKPPGVLDMSVVTAQEARSLVHEADLLIAELERRKRDDALLSYVPHKKQMEFHRCKKRNRWALGGNRTGKTVVGGTEVVWFARGNHPFRKITRPTDGWVVSLTNEVQRDVAQKMILDYLNPAWIKGVKMRDGKADDPAHGIIDFILVESIHGGLSQIGFKSCDQGRERFQGTSKDYIWFDEEPPKEVYDECEMRVMDCKGDIWGTMTPLKGLTWVYDKIYLNDTNDPEVWYVTMSWEDNPHLSAEEIARKIASMTPEELEARREGKFVAISGLVYRGFRENIHVIDPFPVPLEWMDTISIDPGMDKPLSAHWYAVDHDGNVYVCAEWYKAGWHARAHVREIERISNELEWPRDSRGHLTALMDAAADQRNVAGERSVAEVFRDENLNINTKVNKSRFAGIQTVQKYLELRPAMDTVRWPQGKPKLFIFKTCTEMIKEIKKYRWDDKNPDTPKGVDDHAMDELRYYLMSKPENSKVRQENESALLAYKKRKARELERRRRYAG